MASLPVRKKRLRVFQLAAVIFLTVSGGPYGLEPLLTYAGNDGALLLLLITPVLWDIPGILTVLELNGMMPVEGGYYQWVKRALGLRFAFYEGWWTWLYTFVDLAIYPVLFIEYASYFFPEIEAWKIPVCLLIIWAGAGLNILGIVPVGETSLVLGTIVIAPFILLFITAFASHNVIFTMPHFSLNGIHFSSLGLALFTVMWNFCGWDNSMTYAEEVDKPIRTYIRATIITAITIFVVYVIT
jgi:amino acid transporter